MNTGQQFRGRPGAALLFLLLMAAVSSAAPAGRPNVVMIVADDLGFSDVGAYGGEIPTPHLDRLAAEGMRFTQFYNCAVCVTTRSALYTGRQVRPNGGGLRAGTVTLAEVMRTAGYATSLSGKWHLGVTAPNRPIDRGFEEYYGALAGSSNYFNPAIPDPQFYNAGKLSRPFTHNERFLTEFPADFYTTDAFAGHAAARIRRATAAGRPFFVNLCFTAPHFPLHARAEDIDRHRGKYRDGYHALRERRFRRQIELGLFDPAPTKLAPLDAKEGDYRYDYAIGDWNALSPAERQREEERMEVYAAMVDRMDQGVGQVLAALEETGQTSNTVVIFFSDNGGCARWPSNNPTEMAGFIEHHRGLPVSDPRSYEFVGAGWGWAQNAPFRYFKAWTYEGGMCTPMIVRWPGVVRPGSFRREPGHVADFMPTLLELAGVAYPRESRGHRTLPLDGRSLVPIFRGQRPAPYPGSLAWELYGNRAIRDGDWKLVSRAGSERWELYQLATDRTELVDLAARHPDRVAAMAAAWAKWAEPVAAPAN